MKRSTKLALSLVLVAGMVVPALAQDNFPDVPANHWAYEALAKMKAEGLLVGYPDGLYRGPRPASRYELAVAMHAVYTNLKNLIDGMQTQLDALKGINPQDIQNLKDQVANLQSQIDAMKGWGDDIAALKKATAEFDTELKALGVDVEAMKKDLGDLADRVTRLEKRKPAVDISGDVDFWAGTTNSDNYHLGLGQDGHVQGSSGGSPIGLFHDLAVLHEGAFTFSGTNETGPKWKGTIVVGNMLGGQAFGNQAQLGTGGGFGAGGYGTYAYNQGPEDVYVQDLSVKFDTSIIGLGFNAEVGRVAYKLDPYVLQRVDTTPYFTNERWDDGKYRLDGAILGFNLGPVKLHVFGGDTANLDSVQGVDINSLSIANNRVAGGPSEGLYGTSGLYITPQSMNLGLVDRTLGADASFGLGPNGHINLSYLLLEQEEQNPIGDNNLVGDGLANRDNLFGGNAAFGFGRLKVEGGYHIADLTSNDTAANSHDNAAWNAKLHYEANRLDLWGGYREVDQHYYAPGDWGRLGILVNPANIAGWQAGGHLDLSSAIRLSATGEWDKGNKNENNAPANSFYDSPFDTNTTITSYMARLDIRLNPNLSVYGSWEDTKFSSLDPTYFGSGYGPSGNPQYDWTTVGIGYGLSSNAKFNLSYQFSNVGNEVFLPYGTPGGRYTGGILTSQLTVKF
jgi:hypothetical protein